MGNADVVSMMQKLCPALIRRKVAEEQPLADQDDDEPEEGPRWAAPRISGTKVTQATAAQECQILYLATTATHLVPSRDTCGAIKSRVWCSNKLCTAFSSPFAQSVGFTWKVLRL